MAANTVTYFGDVTTVGNTNVYQNFTALGYSIFNGNVFGTGNLVGFASVFSSNLNVSTLNTVSISSQVGIGTSTNLRANLTVAGNVFGSNAFQAPNVFATISANTPALNTSSLFGLSGFVGVGVSTGLGAALQVQGNVFASNAIQSPSINASVSANIQVLNTASIFATSGPGRVGVGASTNLGANLHVTGNLFASNALQAPNILASVSANVGVLNTASIFASSGASMVGVGLGVPLANLHVAGNLFASNALQTPNVLATTSANIGALNTASIFASSGPGRVGVGLATPSANLHVSGNFFASNALQSPVVGASVSANIQALNTASIFATSGPGLVGVGTTFSNASLHVVGNLFAANALQAPNVFAATSANIAVLNSASIFASSGPGRVGVGTGAPAANLHVQGNLFAANAFQTLVTYANVAANVATLLGSAIFGAAGLVGVGTSTGLGANLHVSGNLFAANALQSPVVLATLSANTPLLNTTSVYGKTAGLVGLGIATGIGANLHVQGNVWASNALSGAVQFQNATVPLVTVTQITGPAAKTGVGSLTPGANLHVQGNLWASNALTSRNVFALTANTPSLIVTGSVRGPVGVGGAPTGNTVEITGNLWAANSISTTNLSAPLGNVSVINVRAIYGRSAFQVGIGTSTGLGANLHVQGNAFFQQNVLSTFTGVTNTSVTTFVTRYIYGTNGLVGFGTVPVAGGPILQLSSGNVFASNAFQTAGNVMASGTANTAVLNVTAFANTMIGIGLSTGIGANVHVAGNVFAANAIQTPGNVIASVSANVPGVLNVTYFSSLNLGVRTATNLNANLTVQGNLFASNALQTAGNVVATRANLAVVNTLAIYGTGGNVGIGTSTDLGATLQIQGNIFVANANASLFPALTSPANLVTLNTTTLAFTTNPATIPGPVTWALGSNISVANSYSQGTEVFAPVGVYYMADPLQTAPWAVPGAANELLIKSWIRGVCNEASFWDLTDAPAFSNLAQGPGTRTSSLLLGDGRLVFTQGSNIGTFNPVTEQFSNVIPLGGAPVGPYFGAVLAPSGNVVMIPGAVTSNVGAWDPYSRRFSNVILPGGAFEGGVLDPLGNVVMVPAASTSNIGTFNPALGTFSNVPGSRFDGSFSGACVLANGNVVCVPNTNSNVVQFNPFLRTFSNSVQVGDSGTAKFNGGVLTPSGNVVLVPGASSNVAIFDPQLLTSLNVQAVGGFSGGVLLPTGNVIFVPAASTNVGMLDPVAFSFSNSTSVGAGGYSGGTLIPDGRVVFGPGTSGSVGVLLTTAPAPVEFCRSPFVNKF
jgi:hypothetical protein